MKKLNPPTFAAVQAVEACASGISDMERATVLREALPVIEAAELEYRTRGPAGELCQIAETDNVTPALNAGLMSTIYKRHFVRNGSPSRPLYEQIRMAPEHGICPLCKQRFVATLDHYLPQTRHPKLTLTPINLIPACSDCNNPPYDFLLRGPVSRLVASNGSQGATSLFDVQTRQSVCSAGGQRVGGHFPLARRGRRLVGRVRGARASRARIPFKNCSRPQLMASRSICSVSDVGLVLR